ncbi:hypothetical protein CTI12_AA492370 [Artemisia annua]|uniref:Glycosyltransferase n=1 Tax=Artemisia annua TaxID=35608 RepID=A0A2U1LGU6_ARTAN|nr:hypothetical protein CTI12_AA492370 [Artemisia annua]
MKLSFTSIFLSLHGIKSQNTLTSSDPLFFFPLLLSMASNIVQLNAPTHFPIKLTSSNFPVWRKQIQSTLIGLDLLQYIDGTLATPSQFSDNERKTINPAYTRWYRQDQTLLSAILGSCSDMIQPIISSATSSKEAWDRLLHSYANASRSRIISLKSKLAKNPKGNKSVAEFLNEMRSIADELALIQNPISEEDLVVHIISQLGDEFNSLVAAIKVRESPITYSDLFDKLTDFERMLKEKDATSIPIIPTVNVTQRQNSKGTQFQRSSQGYHSNHRKSRGGYSGNTNRSWQVFPLQVRNTSDVFTNRVQDVLRDGSPLVESQHQNPSQTTTQPSTYDSPIPSSTSEAPSSTQQAADSPSLPTSVTLSQPAATFQEQPHDIFQDEQTPCTFQQHTPNTSQQHTHSPPVTSQLPCPHVTTSQPPPTQSNLQRPTREKKRNPKYYNEKYVNTARFLERTKGTGFVVPSWAPQAQILSHSSTSGFLTHCGWNSILETVVHGVPVIAWPLYAEQKMNAVSLNEGMKIALRPTIGENGIVSRVEIARVVKGLLEGEEGKAIRSRMQDLKEAAANVISKDGCSTKTLAEVASKLKNKD